MSKKFHQAGRSNDNAVFYALKPRRECFRIVEGPWSNHSTRLCCASCCESEECPGCMAQHVATKSDCNFSWPPYQSVSQKPAKSLIPSCFDTILLMLTSTLNGCTIWIGHGQPMDTSVCFCCGWVLQSLCPYFVEALLACAQAREQGLEWLKVLFSYILCTYTLYIKSYSSPLFASSSHRNLSVEFHSATRSHFLGWTAVLITWGEPLVQGHCWSFCVACPFSLSDVTANLSVGQECVPLLLQPAAQATLQQAAKDALLR